MIDKSFWKGRRVLITGHTGFKGGWLCLWLNQLGAKVSGYSLDPPGEPSFFDEASVAEIKIMENNPEFKLRNDAIHQLSKNTGNNKATGNSVDDLASEFSILNLFKGRSYYKNQEASEIVSLNKVL